jgi:hypothetical protein
VERVNVKRTLVNWSLVRYVGLALALAALCGWFLQPWYHGSKDAPSILATILSILAGFLVAVMAIVGDERTLRGKNWRQDTFYLGEVRRQLLRHRVMFYLYLSVLILIFLCSLSNDWPARIQAGIERLVVFASVFALLLSFRLPGELTTRQVDLLQRMIDARRTEQSTEREKDQDGDWGS